MPVDIKISIDLSEGQKRVLRAALVFGAVAATVGVGVVIAAPPHTFSDGDPVSATQMNENFSDLDTRLSMLEFRIDVAVTTGAPNQRLERARLNAAPGCAVQAQSGAWIASTASGGTGDCILSFTPGTFSSIPTCVCTAPSPNVCTLLNLQPTLFEYRIHTPSTGAAVNDGAHIVCVGPK